MYLTHAHSAASTGITIRCVCFYFRCSKLEANIIIISFRIVVVVVVFYGNFIRVCVHVKLGQRIFFFAPPLAQTLLPPSHLHKITGKMFYRKKEEKEKNKLKLR